MPSGERTYGPSPDFITYSSVVARKIVCIALTMAVPHDLKVKAADILNAYVMALKKKSKRTVLSPEFGDNAGKSAVIVQALYCLKNVGTAFMEHTAQCMWGLGIMSCDAYSDLWIKP